MSFQLNALGVMAYAGVDFGPSAKTLGLNVRAIYDKAKRTIIAHEYTIRVEFTVKVDPAGTIDATLNALRFTLMKVGQPLIYRARGMGDISINTLDANGNLVKDIMFGPMPVSFSPTIIGLNAATIVWEVQTTIAPCADAQNSAGSFVNKLMEYNFSCQFSVDDHGYTTRTIRGFLAIPMDRMAGTRTLAETADDYLERIEPDCPFNFRATGRTWEVDETKSRLNFTFTHTQMPDYAPPPGVVDVQADHSTENENPFVFSKWHGTISASYSFAPGADRSVAYQYFADLVLSRINQIKESIEQGSGTSTIRTDGGNNSGSGTGGAGNPTDPGTSAKNKPYVMPVRIRLSEPEIYGRKGAAFSLTYFVFTNTANVFKASLWTPVPHSDYDQWKDSLSGSVFAIRGQAGLTFPSSSDTILDLCAGGGTPIRTVNNPQVTSLQGIINSLSTAAPDQSNSWAMYENKLLHETSDGTAVIRTLPKNQVIPPSAQDPGFNSTNGYIPDNVIDAADVKVQSRVKAGYYVTLVGRAVRVGYTILPPKLITVGGVTAVAANRRGHEFFWSWAERGPGQVLFFAKWRLRFFVPGTPTQAIGAPLTPTTALDEGTGGGDTRLYASGDPNANSDGTLGYDG
jgi:hypothetical protein